LDAWQIGFPRSTRIPLWVADSSSKLSTNSSKHFRSISFNNICTTTLYESRRSRFPAIDKFCWTYFSAYAYRSRAPGHSTPLTTILKYPGTHVSSVANEYYGWFEYSGVWKYGSNLVGYLTLPNEHKFFPLNENPTTARVTDADAIEYAMRAIFDPVNSSFHFQEETLGFLRRQPESCSLGFEMESSS
jgi:hypothetical protein